MGSKHTEVIARGLILEGGRVLLCRNVKGGYHYLPGGHIEFGEAATQALKREIMEEAGLTARVGPPLLVFEQAFEQKGKPHHELTVVFHVEQLADPEEGQAAADAPPAGGLPEVRSREDKIAFDWVELAALPETDLRPLEMKAWLMAGGDGGALTWLSGF